MTRSQFDPGNRIELWFCDDCMTLELCGDEGSFDYHYGDDAEKVVNRCEAGMAALRKQGEVFPDDFDPSEIWHECADCYHVGRDFPKVEVEYEGDSELITICPKCNSEETRERDAGRDEFSWSECDCCGSTLGGSRTRFALFPTTP